jgi:hypothetical protein
MRRTTAIVAGIAAAGLALASFAGEVEARKGVPHIKAPHIAKVGKAGRYASRNVARHAAKDVRHVARNTYYGPRRWVNDIWIGTGLGTGVALVTNNCNYYYKRWQATGDKRWRNKYAACID